MGYYILYVRCACFTVYHFSLYSLDISRSPILFRSAQSCSVFNSWSFVCLNYFYSKLYASLLSLNISIILLYEFIIIWYNAVVCLSLCVCFLSSNWGSKKAPILHLLNHFLSIKEHMNCKYSKYLFKINSLNAIRRTGNMRLHRHFIPSTQKII